MSGSPDTVAHGSGGGVRTHDHLVTLDPSVSRRRGLYLHPSPASEDAGRFRPMAVLP